MVKYNPIRNRSVVYVLGGIAVLLVFAGFRWSDAHRSHGYLGVSVSRIDREEREKIGVNHGVVIEEVVSESPADDAGLKEGDVILYFDGQKIRTAEDLVETVRATEPKSEVKVTVFRGGNSIDMNVTVGRLKLSTGHIFFKGESPHTVKIFRKGGGYLGVHLYDLDAELADYFGTEEDGGALILSVVEGSPADEAGLRSGDVIVEMDEETILCADDVRELLSDFEERDEIEIVVLRKHKEQRFKVELGESAASIHMEGLKRFDAFPEWGRFHFYRYAPKRKRYYLPEKELETIYEWEGEIDPDHLEDLEMEIEEKIRGKLERIDEDLEAKIRIGLERCDKILETKIRERLERIEQRLEYHHKRTDSTLRAVHEIRRI